LSNKDSKIDNLEASDNSIEVKFINEFNNYFQKSTRKFHTDILGVVYVNKLI